MCGTVWDLATHSYGTCYRLECLNKRDVPIKEKLPDILHMPLRARSFKSSHNKFGGLHILCLLSVSSTLHYV